MPKSPGVISGALVVCAQSVVNTTRSPECSGVVVDNLIMATDYPSCPPACNGESAPDCTGTPGPRRPGLSGPERTGTLRALVSGIAG